MAKSRRSLKLEVGAPQRHEGDSHFIKGIAQIVRDGGGTNIKRNVLLESLREGAIACTIRVSDPQQQQGVISGFFVRLSVRGKFEARHDARGAEIYLVSVYERFVAIAV